MRMKCLRIFPEICARTVRSPGNCTRNMVPGSTWVTVPSVTICSSLGISPERYPQTPVRSTSGPNESPASRPSRARSRPRPRSDPIRIRARSEHEHEYTEPTMAAIQGNPELAVDTYLLKFLSDTAGKYSPTLSRFHQAPVARRSADEVKW